MITKNRIIGAAGAVLLLAGLITFEQKGRQDAQELTLRSSNTEGHEHAVIDANQAARVDESAASADVVAKPTREEEVVLTMYDRMATALEQHTQDCEAMGLAVEELVASHGKQVTRLMAERAKLSDAERQAAQTRLEAAAQSRMARVREGLRTGLTTCGTDERLQAALRTLADLNTPS